MGASVDTAAARWLSVIPALITHVLLEDPTMRTMTADRYVSRARFSASDRPVPPDLDVVAAIEARRTRRPGRGQPGAVERVLRSALGRLERTMASTCARDIARRKKLAARCEVQSPPVTAFTDETLAQHRALVEAIRQVEAGSWQDDPFLSH